MNQNVGDMVHMGYKEGRKRGLQNSTDCTKKMVEGKMTKKIT
jgi:hypothetical protein